MKYLTILLLISVMGLIRVHSQEAEDIDLTVTIDAALASTNYKLLTNVANGGVAATSSNYSLRGSVGEFEGGRYNSANYTLAGGYPSQVYYLALRILDLDEDGTISPTDAIFVVNRVGQVKNTLNGLADVNKDGTINQADAQIILDNLGNAP